MGAAALVLGLIALVGSIFLPVFGWIWMIAGVLGIVLGAVGKKKGAKCAVGGMVLSIIALALAVVFWLACAACVAAASTL